MFRTELLLILPLVVAVTVGQTNRGYTYYGTSNVRDQRPQPIYGRTPLVLPPRPMPVSGPVTAAPVAPAITATQIIDEPVPILEGTEAPGAPPAQPAPSNSPSSRPIYTPLYRPLLTPRPIRPAPSVVAPSQPPAIAEPQPTVTLPPVTEAAPPVQPLEAITPVAVPEPAVEQPEPTPIPIESLPGRPVIPIALEHLHDRASQTLLPPTSEPIQPSIVSEPILQPEPIREPITQPEPIPQTESTRQPEPVQKPEPIRQPGPTVLLPEPILHPEPIRQPEPIPQTEPTRQPEPVQEPEPIRQPGPTVLLPKPILHPKPIRQPEPIPQTEPTRQPEPVQEPEPIRQPGPTVLLPEPILHPEPIRQPEPIPQTEPTRQPEPVQEPEPIPHPGLAVQPPEPIRQSDPVSEPAPISQPEPVLQPVPISLVPAPEPQPGSVAAPQSISLTPAPILRSVSIPTHSKPVALPPLLPKPHPVREPVFGGHPQPSVSPMTYYPITPPPPTHSYTYDSSSARTVTTQSPPVVVTRVTQYQPPVTQAPGSFYLDQCRNENGWMNSGYHSVEHECDTYIDCKQGKITKYACPNGLYFNTTAKHYEYPCADPSKVNCMAGDHQELNRNPTDKCPNQYGYYSMNDGDCSRFIMCQEGLATIMNCPVGLVFNPQTSTCDWPVNVPQCNPSVFKDFTCPDPPEDENGQISDIISKYRYHADCKLYIACQLGRPRLLSCERGLAFDNASQSCIDEDYVTDCAVPLQ